MTNAEAKIAIIDAALEHARAEQQKAREERVWDAAYGAAYVLYADRFRGLKSHVGHAHTLATELADEAVKELRRARVLALQART